MHHQGNGSISAAAEQEYSSGLAPNQQGNGILNTIYIQEQHTYMCVAARTACREGALARVLSVRAVRALLLAARRKQQTHICVLLFAVLGYWALLLPVPVPAPMLMTLMLYCSGLMP